MRSFTLTAAIAALGFALVAACLSFTGHPLTAAEALLDPDIARLHHNAEVTQAVRLGDDALRDPRFDAIARDADSLYADAEQLAITRRVAASERVHDDRAADWRLRALIAAVIGAVLLAAAAVSRP